MSDSFKQAWSGLRSSLSAFDWIHFNKLLGETDFGSRIKLPAHYDTRLE